MDTPRLHAACALYRRHLSALYNSGERLPGRTPETLVGVASPIGTMTADLVIATMLRQVRNHLRTAKDAEHLLDNPVLVERARFASRFLRAAEQDGGVRYAHAIGTIIGQIVDLGEPVPSIPLLQPATRAARLAVLIDDLNSVGDSVSAALEGAVAFAADRYQAPLAA